jgi:hypothetical protein
MVSDDELRTLVNEGKISVKFGELLRLAEKKEICISALIITGW